MRRLALGLALLFSMGTLQASSWQTLGEGTARWGLFKLYDAKLLAPPGLVKAQLLEDTTPLKLELCYARRLTVDNFVDGANHVLQNQDLTPELQLAVERLHQAYQPVNKDDCYWLEHQPEQGTSLILNQQALVTIDTPGFKAVYFGIWLGEQPLSAPLKNKLLRGA